MKSFSSWLLTYQHSFILCLPIKHLSCVRHQILSGNTKVYLIQQEDRNFSCPPGMELKQAKQNFMLQIFKKRTSITWEIWRMLRIIQMSEIKCLERGIYKGKCESAKTQLMARY